MKLVYEWDLTHRGLLWLCYCDEEDGLTADEAGEAQVIGADSAGERQREGPCCRLRPGYGGDTWVLVRVNEDV